jgi:hypothetical protein
MKYSYRTYGRPGDYFVSGVTKAPHRYSKRSAHGERKGWKEISSSTIGRFTTREEAQQAGREWVRSKRPPAKTKTPARFEVVVGNIGTVYDGPLWKEALQAYSEYRWQSVANYGRAGGEPVTLFRDGEPKWEYQGTLEE